MELFDFDLSNVLVIEVIVGVFCFIMLLDGYRVFVCLGDVWMVK